MRPTIGIPVKAFTLAKSRLGEVVADEQRVELGRALAEHTARAASEVGHPTVVTGDTEVAAWAAGAGLEVCPDPGQGLDAAARAFVSSVGSERPWMLVHADLPLLSADDLAAMLPEPSIAPSLDGGTSAIAGTGAFEPRFGSGSFHRHQAISARRVVVRPGLAIDLDRPAILRAVSRLPGGAWVAHLP